jgi:hypothetical protein
MLILRVVAAALSWLGNTLAPAPPWAEARVRSDVVLGRPRRRP